MPHVKPSTVQTISLAILLLNLVAGCSLFPKPVELFQKKVRAVPAKTSATIEAEKQAATFAEQKVTEAREAALVTGASTNVLSPLKEASDASQALAFSLGAPASRWSRSGDELATMLGHQASMRDQALERFRANQAPLVGKKIEGSGLFQVPYFVWVGGVALLLWLVWMGSKFAAIAYPPIGVGVAGLSAAGRLAGHEAAEGFGMVVKGIDGARKEIEKSHLAAEVKAWVDGVIIRHQQAAQTSPVIQEAVKQMTR